MIGAIHLACDQATFARRPSVRDAVVVRVRFEIAVDEEVRQRGVLGAGDSWDEGEEKERGEVGEGRFSIYVYIMAISDHL